MKVNPPKHLTLRVTCETRVIKSVSFDLIETFNILLPSQRRIKLASAFINSQKKHLDLSGIWLCQNTADLMT